MLNYSNDPRIVMTLDAGGTNFRFSAISGVELVTDIITLPSHGDNLELSLLTIIDGFRRVQARCPRPPVAISFAFPAPADYPNGIVGDLVNLPGYRGGVPLVAILEEHFGLPTFLNNDGDLFTYGEAIAGLLPYVNGLLEKAQSPKRYRNLFGLTLGTGFGGGIVREGRLFQGDNSQAAEVWLLRNKLYPQMDAEESASIRGVRRVYAEMARLPLEQAPEPREIFEIGLGQKPGHVAAAKEAFRQLGEVVGDALGNALTLVDGLAVIGGGISGAWPLFLPTLMAELNRPYRNLSGNQYSRLGVMAYNLEDPQQRPVFLQGQIQTLKVPGTTRQVVYDAFQRTGVGLSRLGTSRAVAVGACAFALHELDQRSR